MTITISPERMKQIEAVEYGLNGEIGGLPRATYYTPDGRVIRAIPSIREYVVRDRDGKVINSGTRDANLDRGWLLSPPTTRKPFCGTCDRWHDSSQEVKACARQRVQLLRREERVAKKEAVDSFSALEKQVADLQAMVRKLTEAKNGGDNGNILQPQADVPAGEVSRQKGPGGRAKAARRG